MQQDIIMFSQFVAFRTTGFLGKLDRLASIGGVTVTLNAMSGIIGKTFRLNVAMKEQGRLVGTMNLASFPGFYRLQHLSLKGGIGLYLEPGTGEVTV